MAQIGLSFVMLERAEAPNPDALIEAAHALGLGLTRGEPEPEPEDPEDPGPGVATFVVEGGASLLLMLVDAPLPDAARMPTGLASPTPEQIEAGTAHIIVTVLDLPDDPRLSDTLLAKLTAAVVRTSPAIAAMLGHGVTLHRADVFADAAAGPIGVLPMLVCVDVTIAPEPEERISFLTHGLERYGREEFFVTASRTGQGAVEFLLSMVGWMLDDPNKHLPTGDTVGRSAEEHVEIQRVPSPIDEAPEVIRLDLDLD